MVAWNEIRFVLDLLCKYKQQSENKKQTERSGMLQHKIQNNQ